MIPITQKDILARMDGTLLMRSFRDGTLEQLQEFRDELSRRVKERRSATRQSYGRIYILTVIICSALGLLTDASFTQLIAGHITGQVFCAIAWAVTIGAKYRRAARMEKVMFTMVDTAISEKRKLLQQTNPTT